MATSTTYVSKDASAIKDTAAAAFDGWSGHDTHHPVGTNGNYKWRSFLYFPISFTGMTAINSATLHLRASDGYHYANIGSATMTVRRMQKSWGEGTDRGENVWSQNESWDYTNRALSDSYTASGMGTYTGAPADNAWITVDITDIVKAWAPASAGGSGAANYGVILINDNESSTGDYLEFWTDDKGSAYKAYVTVDYTTNTAPNAPSTTTMTPGSTVSGSPEVIHTLTPTFTGEFTDPDAGDTISGVQVIVYEGTAQTTVKWDSGTIATANAAWSVPYGGAALVGNSTYNWKARVKDASGAWSTYSSVLYFKPNSTPLAPTLSLTESPTTDVLTLTPTFNITHNDPDVSDNKATAYTLEIQTAAGAAVASTGDVTLGTAITTVVVTYGAGALLGATALTAGSSYRWRARTKDSNGAWSSYSGWATFTIHITAAATSVSPTGGVTVGTLTPVFSGSRGSTADSLTEVTIEIYASTDLVNAVDSQVQTSGVTSSGFSFTWPRNLTNSTTYYWRVKLKTTTYGYGAWTTLTANSFTIDTSSVTLSLPTTNDGTTQRVTSTTPGLPISRSTSFRYYAIEVRDMSGNLAYYSGDVDNTTSVTSLSRTYGATTGIGAGGSAASVPLAALAWNTQYQWRAKVSNASIADLQGLSYGSYATFWTDAAGTPTLSGDATGNAWLTTANPVFTLTRAGTDTIATAQVLVYQVVNGTPTLVWDSGTVDVVDGTSASITYGTGGTGESPTAEPALVGGYVYQWQARYTKTTGPIGDYSAVASWYHNAAPSIPVDLSPASGASVNGTNPVFAATFVDADIATKGDTPSEWNIVITNENDTAFRTVTLTTGLNAGPNEWTYTGSPTLTVGNTYKWYTYFKDSKAVTGASSAVRTFKAAAAPVATITSPSDESTVSTNRVTFTYSYSSGSSTAQDSYRLRVSRTLTASGGGDDPAQDVLVYDSGWTEYSVASGANGTVVMPSGYTKSGFRYRARLDVKDVDGVQNTTDLQAFNINVSAPPAMAEVTVSPEDDRSRVRIRWTTQESAKPTGFAGFYIYRRLPGDDDFTLIATQSTWAQVSTYYDYYAGNNITYEYMVTQVKGISDDADVESPDSEIGASELASDEWLVIGADRAASHTFALPVQDEEHERPVQQEIFEPVGSQRKVIARGAVLGHEGSLDVLWHADESENARVQVEYLYANRGPHILKSPFGDVWEVEFAGPTHKYQMGGHLSMNLSYIETSNRTSDLTYSASVDSSGSLSGTVV